MKRFLLAILLVLVAVGASAQAIYIPPRLVPTPAGTALTSSYPLLLPDGTAAAPSLATSSDPTTGFYSAGLNTWGWSGAGTARIQFSTTAIKLTSTSSYFQLGGDTNLYRDAAATFAIRNGGTAGAPVPQALNIYNFCDGAACATGYERASLYWSGSIFNLAAQSAGTGVARGFAINTTLTTDLVKPASTDSTNLGSTTALWKDFHLSRSIQGSKSKALTGGAATTFLRVAVPQTAAANYGGGDIGYTVYATDATDSQSLVGKVYFAMVNKAGTETCTIGEVGTPVLAQSSASTLTCAWTCATASADTVDLAANCASGLVETTFTIQYRGDMQQVNTYTPQ